MAGPIRETREGGIVTVMLDRPGKINALDRAMWAGLGETVAGLAGDDAVRCIILRGAGGEAEFAECVRWTHSEDFRTGALAFLEKREPRFTGR